MRAAVLDEYIGAAGLRVEDVAKPQPGPGEVLVRVVASPINHPQPRMLLTTTTSKTLIPTATAYPNRRAPIEALFVSALSTVISHSGNSVPTFEGIPVGRQNTKSKNVR